MRECPYCGQGLGPNQARCHNCEMPVVLKYPTPSELAAQTTKSLQKLLAAPPDVFGQGKQEPTEERTRSLVG